MSAPSPTVSVVLPTYNRSDRIVRSIQSVLGQSYSAFELIVVDDASTDDTVEAIRSFADPRLRCLQHERNRGGSAARNTGIREARGAYIAFLDDDDEWLPNHLQVTVNAMAKLGPEWGVVYTGRISVSPGKEKPKYPNPKWEGDILTNLLVEGSIGTPTILVRRQCFEQVGLFDEAFPRHQDWEMHVRIAEEFLYYPIQEVTVKVHRSGNPSSTDIEQSKVLFLRKFQDEIASLNWVHKRRSYSKHYLYMAQLYLEEGRYRVGFKYLCKSLVQYPPPIKSFISTLLRTVR